MKLHFTILLSCALLTTGCSKFIHDLSTENCSADSQASNYSKAEPIQQAIHELTNKNGIPGCALAVYSDDGWFTASTGFAKLEDKTPMQSCHLQYLQSIAKTYMAVGILKLYEQGKIQLDSSMTVYLPKQFSRHIVDGKKITVRMLLNHTSGIPEYNSIPAYITKLLQHPEYAFTPGEYLEYISGKALDFTPGSKYSYRNTNYVILALIADAVTGDHAEFLAETIFQPLGLTNTFYRNSPKYLTYPALVNSYWDRHSDGVIENASQLQRNNVAALVGDDGIVATPMDAVKFLKGLIEGKLLAPATLELMMTWEKDSNGNDTYGLGLDNATMRGVVGYGHSGGGIGAGCQLYYFPSKKIYMFVGINLGTVTDSPLHTSVQKTLDKLYAAILE